MAKYSKKAQDTVESAMHRRKKGTLKSSSGDKVTSRKQAIAIGLSEAREKGYKAPPEKKSSSRKSSSRKSSSSTARKNRTTGRAKRSTTSRSRSRKKSTA